MFELTVDTHFDAAHCLEGYKGECSRVHGHTWTVWATVEAAALDDLGMSIDFKLLKAALKRIVDRYDHLVLNDLDEFSGINPTAELIAKSIYDSLADDLDSENVTVLSVTVGEGDRNRVAYRPDNRR